MEFRQEIERWRRRRKRIISLSHRQSMYTIPLFLFHYIHNLLLIIFFQINHILIFSLLLIQHSQFPLDISYFDLLRVAISTLYHSWKLITVQKSFSNHSNIYKWWDLFPFSSSRALEKWFQSNIFFPFHRLRLIILLSTYHFPLLSYRCSYVPG